MPALERTTPAAASDWRASPRVPALDLARGLALIAMVMFHAGWDVSFLGLAWPQLRFTLPWQVFGHAIAATFLFISGVALVLAQRAGADSLAFLQRLGKVAGAALLVTLVTYLALPDLFVFFGILHLIALGSVLALPFLRAPVWGVVLAAGAVAALPLLVSTEALSSPWLVWLGLGEEAPNSSDFVPVFPWFAFMLAGVALARVTDWQRFAAPAPQGRLARLIAFAGRHSLLIYLVHQPLLYGGFWLLAQATLPRIDPEERNFALSCQRECTGTGGEAARCTAICSCAIRTLKEEQLWSEVIANRVTEQVQQRFQGISLRCAQSAVPNSAK